MITTSSPIILKASQTIKPTIKNPKKTMRSSGKTKIMAMCKYPLIKITEKLRVKYHVEKLISSHIKNH